MEGVDLHKLTTLRLYAETHMIGADAILAIQERRSKSVVARDPKHRAFLSDGVVVIFSIEDFSKVPDELLDERFRGQKKIRHASISQQLGVGGRYVGNMIPNERLLLEIIRELGFGKERLIFPSPERAGPLIQHVIESMP